MLIGRKGIEPLTALAIEFTAQPIIPTNGTFLFLECFLSSKNIYYNINLSFIIKSNIVLNILSTQKHFFISF